MYHNEKLIYFIYLYRQLHFHSKQFVVNIVLWYFVPLNTEFLFTSSLVSLKGFQKIEKNEGITTMLTQRDILMQKICDGDRTFGILLLYMC